MLDHSQKWPESDASFEILSNILHYLYGIKLLIDDFNMQPDLHVTNRWCRGNQPWLCVYNMDF